MKLYRYIMNNPSVEQIVALIENYDKLWASKVTLKTAKCKKLILMIKVQVWPSSTLLLATPMESIRAHSF